MLSALTLLALFQCQPVTPCSASPALPDPPVAPLVVKTVDEGPQPQFLPGMLVEVWARGKRKPIASKTTDALGYAAFDLEPGRYDVTARSPGFKSVKKKVQVTAGENRLLQLVLRVGGVTVVID